MKATMNLDDQLYRRVKIRAAEEGTTVTSLVEQALVALLSAPSTPQAPFQITVLPSAGGVRPGVDLTSNAAMTELLDSDVPAVRIR
ncbi:plasmid stability protein [Nakamurella sp. UYEF19]|uniref:CopG family transcriptional regulator n=1 Tax=Nakamurella sp. UYEF19 TaxID=1756392 RepID=UPI0033952736